MRIQRNRCISSATCATIAGANQATSELQGAYDKHDIRVFFTATNASGVTTQEPHRKDHTTQASDAALPLVSDTPVSAAR